MSALPASSLRPSFDLGVHIACWHGVAYAEIMRQGKTPRVVAARREYWFRLVFDLSYSLPRAARVTGHHHTTVLHGLRVFAQEHFGTPYRSTLQQIREAWFQSAMESCSMESCSMEAAA